MSPSLLGGLISGRSNTTGVHRQAFYKLKSWTADALGSQNQQMQAHRQVRKKPEEAYREQVLQKLKAFEADELQMKIEFEPIGNYTEEQKMYRYIV